jgi:hypothetical protein
MLKFHLKGGINRGLFLAGKAFDKPTTGILTIIAQLGKGII